MAITLYSDRFFPFDPHHLLTVYFVSIMKQDILAT